MFRKKSSKSQKDLVKDELQVKNSKYKEYSSDMTVRMKNDGSPYIELDQYEIRLEEEELSGEFEKRAKIELFETPEKLQEGLENFRQLIRDETGLQLPIEDDKFLLKFLRPFKFNAEHAFKILKKFYKFKVKHPKYGGIDVTPDGVRLVFDEEVFQLLPIRTLTGGRIMVINVGTKWNPKKVPLDYLFKGVMVLIEIAMREPKTQVGGVSVILNMEGLSLNHIYQFSPSIAKLIVDWVQECAPVRLRGIHIVNQPLIFNILYKIFKPFLGEYLKKRLNFHGTDFESLCAKLGKDCLPEQYGGVAKIPEYPGALFSDLLFHYQEDFKVYHSYGYTDEIKHKLENGKAK